MMLERIRKNVIANSIPLVSNLEKKRKNFRNTSWKILEKQSLKMAVSSRAHWAMWAASKVNILTGGSNFKSCLHGPSNPLAKDFLR